MDGSRENEFSKKLNGVPYIQILQEGGGILSTVNATKKATFDELYNKAKKSLDRMLGVWSNYSRRKKWIWIRIANRN
jgi:Imidazolonepropionase and related amidohydrolases